MECSFQKLRFTHMKVTFLLPLKDEESLFIPGAQSVKSVPDT